jgi:hypothetical protein
MPGPDFPGSIYLDYLLIMISGLMAGAIVGLIIGAVVGRILQEQAEGKTFIL